MTTNHSSPEHIVSCLTDLRRVFGTGQKTTAEHLSWQNGLYIEALADLMPEALTAACKQIIREGERFPRPKEIRDVAKELIERRQAVRALANPNPNEPENFLARCKRLGGHDAAWHRAHHHLLEPLFDAHCGGFLTDPYLEEAIHGAERGVIARAPQRPAQPVARAAE